MLKQIIVLCAIASAVLCRHAPSNLNTLYNEQTSEKTMGSDDKGDDSFMANWDISSVYNSIKNSTNSDISVYLKMKFLEGIESATRGDLDLGAGIRLIRDNSKGVDAIDNDKFDMRSLPRGLGDKEDALTSMIWKKINRLLRTHTMQVSKVLHTVENGMQDFAKYIWKYELPAFLLDVMEYKVTKFEHVKTHDKRKRKKQKKKKQKKKKQKKKKRKKKPNDGQDSDDNTQNNNVEHVNDYSDYTDYSEYSSLFKTDFFRRSQIT